MPLTKYNAKETAYGLAWKPYDVSITVATAANTITISGSFTNLYGQKIEERLAYEVYFTTAATSYVKPGSGASSIEFGGTHKIGVSGVAETATESCTYVTCSSGTIDGFVLSSAATITVYPKFIVDNRVINTTSAITFS